MELGKIISELNDNYKLKYEPWWLTENIYTNGHPSWVLYENGEAVAGISNDGPDKNHVIIRHIESFKKGSATRLILSLLDRGFIVETGKPEYNSISPDAPLLVK